MTRWIFLTALVSCSTPKGLEAFDSGEETESSDDVVTVEGSAGTTEGSSTSGGETTDGDNTGTGTGDDTTDGGNTGTGTGGETAVGTDTGAVTGGETVGGESSSDSTDDGSAADGSGTTDGDSATTDGGGDGASDTSDGGASDGGSTGVAPPGWETCGDEPAPGTTFTVDGNTEGEPHSTTASCAFLTVGHTTADYSYSWTPDTAGTFCITTDGSSFDTVLSVWDDTCDVELACDDESGTTEIGGFVRSSAIDFEAEAGKEYIILVDGNNATTDDGIFRLTVSAEVCR